MIIRFDGYKSIYKGTEVDEAVGRAQKAITLDRDNVFTGTNTFEAPVYLGDEAEAITPDSSDNSSRVATTAFVKEQGFISDLTSEMITTALGFTPYSSSNPEGYEANVINTIKVNNVAQTVTSKTVNIAVPTKVSDLVNDSGFITDITSADVIAALDYTPENVGNKVTSLSASSTDTEYPSAKIVYTLTNANSTAINTINGKIPSEATSSNQLADKAFVNSSIATSTADFVGTFDSLAELEAYTGPVTNNDYAFVVGTDSAGNTVYNRYKYTTATIPASWQFEYALNNSSFTATQWAAINSGITSSGVTLLGTALQPNDNISQLTNDAGYITGITSTDVTTALGYTPYNATNPDGFISGITSADVTTALGYTPYNATNPDKFISNTATGSGALTILGTVSAASGATNVGDGSIASSLYTTALGKNAKSQGQRATALGYNAKASATDAIQIGYGTNSTISTLSVGFNNTNYQLLDGTTGLIPDARISSNIARVSAIPTDTSDLTNGAGYITGISSSDVTTALGYTPYDATNPDGFITGITSSDVTTALGYTPYNGATNPNGYISSASISSLTDTSVSNVSNGQALLYNSTSGKWENEDIITSVAWGGITGTLADQTDLQDALDSKTTMAAVEAKGYITGVTSSMITSALGYTPYDGATNPNGYIVGISGSDVTEALGYTPENVTNKVTSLSASSTDTQYPSAKCVYDSIQASTITTLAGLTDVNVSSPSNNQGLLYDSTSGKWENKNVLTSVSWGEIGGTLSSQTDLQNALDSKTTMAAVEAKGYITGITGSDVVSALGYTPYDASNPNGYIIGISSSDVTTALGYTPYNSTNPDGYISGISSSDVITALGFTPASESALTSGLASKQDTLVSGTNIKTVNSTSLLGSGDIAVQSVISSNNKLSSDLVDDTNKTHKFATAAQLTQISTNQTDISAINEKIPSEASSSNQLADKSFVNSSIATNTANFIGTFSNVSELESYTGTITNNDYAFVINSVVTNSGSDWTTFSALDAYNKDLLTNFDYAWVVNGSNFDLYRFDIVNQQWDLKVSNTAKADVTLNTAYNRYKATVSGSTVTWEYEYTLNNSSFTAAQWSAINSGITSSDVALIGTALQPNDNISSLTNDSGYITGITSTDVTSALGYTPYDATNPSGYTSNVGTVTSVNGTQPDASGNVSLSISTSLSGLTDVSLSSPAQGQNLTYDAVTGKWKNTSTSATVAWGGITGTLSDQTDLQNALDSKTTMAAVEAKGYITGITSSDVTTALGYTPVNPLSLSTVATSGDYDDLTNKPTIPTVGNGTVTFTQGGVNKGSITMNQSGNTTIALEQGGTVDQTYDGTSANAQSGVAIEGELSKYVQKQVGNTTINNTANSISMLVTTNATENDVPTQYVTQVTADQSGYGAIVAKMGESAQGTIVGVTLNGVQMTQATSSGENQALLTVDNNNNLNVNGNALATLNDLNSKQDVLTAGTDLEIVVGSGTSNTVSGTNSITLSNAAANSLSSVIVYGKCSQTGIPTTSNPLDIVCNNGAIKYNTGTSSFYTEGTSETVIDSLNNTAIAEMLLGFGDYIDTQDLLGVGGTRKVGLMVLTGTEEFNTTTLTNCYSLESALGDGNLTDRTVYCTHFQHTSTLPSAGSRQGYALIGNRNTPSNAYTVGFGATTEFSTVALFKSWLSTQYANGTPVIIAYPLATPTIFGATTQTLNTKSGSNQITITQSAISNLNIKATYTTDSTSTINFTNDTGYITGIDSTDVTTALGYTPVNPSSLATVATSGSYNDLSNKPTIPEAQIQSDWNQTNTSAKDYIKNKPTIPSEVVVDQTYDGSSTNAQSGVAIAGAGFITGITSNDVTTALGYTPYNSTNPSGYITGIDSTDVTTALGYTPVNPSSLSTVATSGSYNDLSNKPTIPDVSNFVQSSVEDSSVGISSSISYLEGFAPTMQLNYGNYQFAISTSEGAVMEAVDTSNNNQFASSVMPTGMLLYQGSQQAQLSLSNNNLAVNGNEIATQTFVTSQGYTTNTGTVTSVNNVQPDSNGNVTIQTGGTVDQTYDGTSTNAQSGVAIAGELANYVEFSDLASVATSGSYNDLTDKPTIPSTSNLANKDLSNLSSTGNSKFQSPLISGTNIKTINDTSLLGSGNIAVQSVISDLATIRSGASAGATAVQPSDLSTVATSGSYNDLTDKPTIPDVSNFVPQTNGNGTIANANNVVRLSSIDSNNNGGGMTVEQSGLMLGYQDAQNDTSNCFMVLASAGAVLMQGSQNTPRMAMLGVSQTNNLTVNGSEIATQTFVTSQGYTTNTGTVTSVNNVQPDSNGNVSLTIPTEVFIAEYGVTSFSDIQTAYNAGKSVFCKDGNQFFMLNICLSPIADFSCIYTGTNATVTFRRCELNNGNTVWSKPTVKTLQDKLNYTPENVSNKVTSISSSSTDTQYPSAKCVYDAIEGLQTLQPISTTSGTLSLVDGTSMYKLTPSGATTISFTNNTTASSTKAYTFELCIDMQSAVYTITFPTIAWQDGETPDMSSSGLYFFAFRTIDGGLTWLGNLQGVW